MEMTTYDMERPAVMPTAAPVGAVTLGHPLAGPTDPRMRGTFAPFAPPLVQGNAVKPWIIGVDRRARRFAGLAVTDRSTRRLGSRST